MNKELESLESLVLECMEDLSHTWEDFIAECERSNVSYTWEDSIAEFKRYSDAVTAKGFEGSSNTVKLPGLRNEGAEKL